MRKNVRNIIFIGRISREKNICLLKKLIEKIKKLLYQFMEKILLILRKKYDKNIKIEFFTMGVKK